MAEQPMAARDNMTAVKIHQAHVANKDHHPDPEFKVGDKVMLATVNK